MKLFTFFKVIWLHISCIFLSSALQITEFNECTLCRRIIFKEPFYKIFIVSFFRLWKPSGKNTSSKLIKTVLFSFSGDTCDNNWFRGKTFSFYVEKKKCLVLLFVCIWPYSRTIHHPDVYVLGTLWRIGSNLVLKAISTKHFQILLTYVVFAWEFIHFHITLCSKLHFWMKEMHKN